MGHGMKRQNEDIPIPMMLLNEAVSAATLNNRISFADRGHAHMTSVQRGREGGGWLNSDQRMGGCVNLVLTRGREGVQSVKNLADVICESPLISPRP